MQIPYHRAFLGEEEINEVVATLRSGWLTSGKRVVEFERRFAAYKGAGQAVAVNSCTAGLFLALKALDLKPGDEVITTPYTFVSTVNVILHAGATPVLADIHPHTLNLAPEAVYQKISTKTRAILPVHIGGNPCNMEAFNEIAQMHNLKVVEDCAHAIEAEFDGQQVGTLGDAGSFSFYATKNITSGEGGMILAKDPAMIPYLQKARLHGMSKNAWERRSPEEYVHYDVDFPGYKCNLTDLAAAIGIHQMDRLEGFYHTRKALWKQYNEAFGQLDTVELIQSYPKATSALHLYILKLIPEALKVDRDELIRQIQSEGIQCSVNYTPVHLFSWFQKNLGTKQGGFPHAERCGANVISLPFYPGLQQKEVDYLLQGIGCAHPQP